MFYPDWLILRILHQSFEIERPKGHWSEVVVHLYITLSAGTSNVMMTTMQNFIETNFEGHKIVFKRSYNKQNLT